MVLSSCKISSIPNIRTGQYNIFVNQEPDAWNPAALVYLINDAIVETMLDYPALNNNAYVETMVKYPSCCSI